MSSLLKEFCSACKGLNMHHIDCSRIDRSPEDQSQLSDRSPKISLAIRTIKEKGERESVHQGVIKLKNDIHSLMAKPMPLYGSLDDTKEWIKEIKDQLDLLEALYEEFLVVDRALTKPKTR